MIRIAAAGDIHFDRNSQGKFKPHLENLNQKADLLLLAGDLTQTGHAEEANILAKELHNSPVPVFAVLGNHDFHTDQVPEVCKILESANVNVLENKTCVVEVQKSAVGIVGLKGFGGGFMGACGSDFGEKEMKAFIHHTKILAHGLHDSLLAMKTDYKIVLMHYSPIPGTLTGEKKEIYPFLGSYLFAEAIDAAGADIVFHGHAHRGIEKGVTPGGIPVRNVAQPVIRHIFNIYTLNKEGIVSHSSHSPQNSGPNVALNF
ncbi:MAG: metallophosphoesterase [Oligoflexia bacterium]|nr:metallophosphoesterase [Oligoflexia bacterium]